jgi:acetylornithine deacetylase/succinyl-diaminopimelate desuccinylase-like protein
MEELMALLRIPSVSTDPARAGDVREAGEWVLQNLRGMGLQAELCETGGHPIVYAEWLGAGEGAPTVLVYGHYDVQPPDPLELWETGPFEPTIRDGKLFARGATDDKGQMFAHLKGVEAHLKVRGKLPINVKFMIEGEEEVGSKHLAEWVEANKARLACDAVVISDTSMFAPGVPAIVYGLRGLTYFQLDIEGPGHDLHSGLYGGAVANPINTLCEVIGKLKDTDGRVTVAGFYDNVRALTEAERSAWAKLPHDDEGLRREVGAERLTGEVGYTSLERCWGRPTLDCNGVWGGFTGEGAKTVLPSKASAKFSCRLVPDQTPEEIEDKVEAHLREIIPTTVRWKLHRMHGGRPVIVDTEGPAVQAARAALAEAFGAEAVFIRGGGSIPVVADFTEILGAPVVLMGFGLNDDRLHSPNEKINLECFYGGVVAASLFHDAYAKQK